MVRWGVPDGPKPVDTETSPVWTGSTSAERVAVDRRRDSAKARSGDAAFYSRGLKVTMLSAPCPRKESKTIGFGGVLSSLSFAGERKGAAGGIYGYKMCGGGRPFRRFAPPCPPLCQPIPGHYRARQSGHFLEIGSLLPPLAALHRFPLAQGRLWGRGLRIATASLRTGLAMTWGFTWGTVRRDDEGIASYG